MKDVSHCWRGRKRSGDEQETSSLFFSCRGQTLSLEWKLYTINVDQGMIRGCAPRKEGRARQGGVRKKGEIGYNHSISIGNDDSLVAVPVPATLLLMLLQQLLIL